jgi:aryl-alcohol dehydrogenase-like predicted oxidoreductase
MEYRQHDGETLSEIGLGSYALSGAYGHSDPDAFAAVVRRAYELGVTFFDTANIYGPAETVLCEAVRPFRDEVMIATKVGARADGKLDCSAAHVISSCEASLERLGTTTIDLYQIHFNDPETPVSETLSALEELKTAGKVRHYGVGHLPLDRLHEYLNLGQVFSVLVELSAAARDARRDVLPMCQEHGVGVLAFSVTGRGLLSGRIGPDHHFGEGDIRRIDALFQRERFRSGLRIAGMLKAIAERHGRTPVQIAIAWVLAQRGIMCALTGTTSPAHLEENLAVSGWSLPPDELKELERFLGAEDARLYGAQIKQVAVILKEPPEGASAMTDLAYVLETLVELRMAQDEDVLPRFQRLLACRRMDHEQSGREIRALHTELRSQFLQAVEALGSDEQGDSAVIGSGG